MKTKKLYIDIGLYVDNVQWPSGTSGTRHWITDSGIPVSRSIGSSKVDSAFHPFEVYQVSTRNSYGFSDSPFDNDGKPLPQTSVVGGRRSPLLLRIVT